MELSAIVLVIGGMASLFVSAYKLGHYKGHAKGYKEAGEFYGDSRVGRAVDMSGNPDDPDPPGWPVDYTLSKNKPS